MKSFSDLSRKQVIVVSSGILLVAFVAAGVLIYVATKDKPGTEEVPQQTREEKEKELGELREETSKLEETDDPQEQEEQLENLRRESELESELSGEEEKTPEEQVDELQNLREQSQ